MKDNQEEEWKLKMSSLTIKVKYYRCYTYYMEKFDTVDVSTKNCFAKTFGEITSLEKNINLCSLFKTFFRCQLL